MSAWVIGAKTESVSSILISELLAKSNMIVAPEMSPTSGADQTAARHENSSSDAKNFSATEEETSTADDDVTPLGDWKKARRLTSEKRVPPTD